MFCLNTIFFFQNFNTLLMLRSGLVLGTSKTLLMLRSELVLGTSKTLLMVCSELVLGTSKTQMKQIPLSDVEGEPVKIKKMQIPVKNKHACAKTAKH